MSKIVILGAGSIGCWIGGQAIAGGADVTLIGRARYADQIAEHGLTLTHHSRPKLHLPSVKFSTDPAALRGAEIVALCVKSQDTADAAKQIAQQAPDALVISFQNGIRNPEILREVLPPGNVIPAIVPFNVTPTAPGSFHCGTAGPLVMARHAGFNPLRDAFDRAGQDATLSDNILGDQWAKMIVNLNNGLNTLSGGTLLAGLGQRDYRRALSLCIAEALSVASAQGVQVGQFNGRSPAMLAKTLRLPNWAYRALMQRIVKIDATARSSMLDDLESGRAPEIEYLQGEIVRQAKAIGQTASANAAIYKAVLAAFEAGESPRLSGTAIYTLVT